MVPRSTRRGGYEDLNQFIEALRETRDLIEIRETLNPRFEVSAVLGALGEEGGPAALFSNIAGFPGKVVAGNLLGHRRRIAMALGVPEKDVTPTYLLRKNQRISPKEVKKGPVTQISIQGEKVDLLKTLPALTHHEKDASPYLTCAVTFARDPETGRQSMGMHRIQIQSKQELGICLATPPLSHFLKASWKKNRPLEVAVVIGPDPAVTIASVTRCPGGEDKMEIAGGFRQKPIEMVKCSLVDLRVPAKAQYLIEGTISPEAVAPEGIFGDSSGTYVEAQSPVILVASVSHREKPIYQALQTWSSEDDALLNLCFGSDLWEEVRGDYPMIRDLHMVPATLCAHAIAQVSPCSRPLRRSLMVALLNRNPFVKKVILVDEDVDIRNPREVDWAVATRFQAGQDLILLPDVQGSVIDPSALSDGSTTKMAMDATFPKEKTKFYEKVAVPTGIQKRAREILDKNFPGVRSERFRNRS